MPIPRAPVSATTAPRCVDRLLPALEQPRELGGAADERRERRPTRARAAAARPARSGLSDGILVQDRVLQRAQLRAGLDAEVAGEHAARVLVGVERLRLAPAAVEREHELGDEPLARRMLGDEPAQLRDQLRVAAGGRVGLDARLQRGELLLLEPGDLGGGERLVRQVGERRPAPHVLRLAQERRGLLGLARGERAAAALDQLVEAFGVELAGVDAQPVARRRSS